jgi:hypothetical protein
MDLLPDTWPLITGVLSTLGALVVGAFWAGYKIGAQGKATLQETHASHIALLHERLDFSKQKEEAALRRFGELKAEIPLNAPKLLTTKVQEVDAAVTDWATANSVVESTLTAGADLYLRSAQDRRSSRKSGDSKPPSVTQPSE